MPQIAAKTIVISSSNLKKEEQKSTEMTESKKNTLLSTDDFAEQEEKTKNCFCHRDFTVEDLTGFGISIKKAKNFIDGLNNTLKEYSINTCLKKIHFLAQIRHESGDFIYTEEIASGSGYEGRKDLGNVQQGDGIKFKGRGLIQITGRKNYSNYGNYKQLDFTQNNNNLLLSELPYCIDSAGWYWQKYLNVDLNIMANENDLIYITYRINGGFNGLLDRKTKLIAMLTQLKCNNFEYNKLEYLMRDSRCIKLHDAVFKYARLNTSESKECYSKYLLLTQNYLEWSTITGWEKNSEKNRNKERIERYRLIAVKESQK